MKIGDTVYVIIVASPGKFVPYKTKITNIELLDHCSIIQINGSDGPNGEPLLYYSNYVFNTLQECKNKILSFRMNI